MEETTTITNTNAGFQPETGSIIERADSIAKRIEEANKKAEELLKKNEDTLSRILLSGRSTAGSTTQQIIDPKKEQEDRINRIIASTGMKI